MPSLSKENRKLLENTVAAARVIAVKGATTVLRDQYAVGESAPWPHMSDLENKLRVKLRAHGRQLGDRRDPHGDTQELDRLVQACAYEHWHRMLFARFLAENDLLLDPDHGVAMTLEEIRELAQEQHRDWQELAAELAQRMLLAVFRPEDPVLSITLPPETRLQLEEKLALLPAEVFLADDSLGWVYQFWQRDEKDRVNKSEVKIGAGELPAVTQLFTEDYMVLFLLDNTLGAWWTAKRRSEGYDPLLPGYTFTYLRLNEDESPAAGSFDGWPRTTKELRVLDPCMGSGHFLVFALPILVRMRMEEEGLELKNALVAVLRDNLFGLEIDGRCAQIAAFNLALAAWRMAGEHFALPELNLACSGVGPNATKEQWIKLGEEIAACGGMPASTNLFGTEDSLLSEPVKRTMESLHELFSQAPVLGSLIDPSRLRVDLFRADYKSVAPLLATVLKAENATEETREQVIAAAGMVKASELLSGKYNLVITNVPYLGFGKQIDSLRTFAAEEYPDAENDLATIFISRCFKLSNAEGAVAVVSPQSWLYQIRCEAFRRNILSRHGLTLLSRLGSGAFETISGEVVKVSLSVIYTRPTADGRLTTIDVSGESGSQRKSIALVKNQGHSATVNNYLAFPNSRIILDAESSVSFLANHASILHGQNAADNSCFNRQFWEVSAFENTWRTYQVAPEVQTDFGGRSQIVRWENENGMMARLAESVRHLNHKAQQWRSGKPHWGKRGVAVSLIGRIIGTLYDGDIYGVSCGVLIPNKHGKLPAIWEFVRSGELERRLRVIDPGLAVQIKTVLDVPFDLEEWATKAEAAFPNGLRDPESDDPTQWLFHGHPEQTVGPLQVGVARLLGYRWPAESDGEMHLSERAKNLVKLCDELARFATNDGIVCIQPIRGEDSAADRLRALLSAAYGKEWSAVKLAELLGDNESLDNWLRDRFFEEHCQLFHQRPFVWHVWDGRKDGFHALVNYHKLSAPNGEGRKTLEKLIYTTLGDWITRQRADVAAGADGADGRLAAAEYLKVQLEKILKGETPYDIFIRWKPLDQQPVGWEPDINDGLRMNIRPWLTATPHRSGRRDGCILRVTPKIKYGKDRGKEPLREKVDFPWFWTWDEKTDDFAGGTEFDGARWNEPHYSLTAKQKARDRKMQLERA